jgi:hypothetical protein
MCAEQLQFPPNIIYFLTPLPLLMILALLLISYKNFDLQTQLAYAILLIT